MAAAAAAAAAAATVTAAYADALTRPPSRSPHPPAAGSHPVPGERAAGRAAVTEEGIASLAGRAAVTEEGIASLAPA
jgi:hypothetical protein